MLNGPTISYITSAIEGHGAIQSDRGIEFFGKPLEEILAQAIKNSGAQTDMIITANVLDKLKERYEFHVYSFSNPKAREQLREYPPQNLKERLFPTQTPAQTVTTPILPTTASLQ